MVLTTLTSGEIALPYLGTIMPYRLAIIQLIKHPEHPGMPSEPPEHPIKHIATDKKALATTQNAVAFAQEGIFLFQNVKIKGYVRKVHIML